MTTNTADIVNEALSLMGNNSPQVTGQAPTFDSSPAGVAAAALYTPCVAAVMRAFEYDFSRTQSALKVSGNGAPFSLGFSFEYLYPALALEIWQILDPSNMDANNPLPTDWVIGNTIVGTGALAVVTKVIWTNIAGALAVYDNNPPPSVWDYTFRDAAVRRLASAFSTALAGRPETAQVMLDSGNLAAALAAQRDG